MPRRRARLLALAALALAMRVAGVAGVRVRPSSAMGARRGRAARLAPKHDGWGARAGHGATTNDERARTLMRERANAAADAARAEALRARRLEMDRESEGEGGTARRRSRRLTQTTSESTYVEVGDDDASEGENSTFEVWTSLESAPASAVCDGCKLTVRGVHADAMTSARTTPQSSWKALDESLREDIVRLVWRETTCARFLNVTALRREKTSHRLVDVRADTRDSEITNPGEARLKPEDNVDAFAIRVLSNICTLLREDAQANDWLTSALAAIDDVRPMTDAQARRVCDKITDDVECAAAHDEL
jgi:hypothetical protein